MSNFLHADSDNAKAIAVPCVFSENSRAKNDLTIAILDQSKTLSSGNGLNIIFYNLKRCDIKIMLFLPSPIKRFLKM